MRDISFRGAHGNVFIPTRALAQTGPPGLLTFFFFHVPHHTPPAHHRKIKIFRYRPPCTEIANCCLYQYSSMITQRTHLSIDGCISTTTTTGMSCPKGLELGPSCLSLPETSIQTLRFPLVDFQVDCSLVGVGGQLPSLGFLREAVSMLMLRYPSRLGNLFIVNSGNVIYYLWQAISRLLPPVRTIADRCGIRVCLSSAQSRLSLRCATQQRDG